MNKFTQHDLTADIIKTKKNVINPLAEKNGK